MRLLAKKRKGSDDSNGETEDLRMAIIKRPALSLLGFGTYSQMNELMTEENFESGDLTRFFVFFHSTKYDCGIRISK